MRQLVFVAALIGALAFAACGGKSNKANSSGTAGTNSTTTVAVTPPAAATPRAALTPNAASTPVIARPSATPTETPDDSPMARLVVPKANINNRFVTLGIIASSNTMDSPKTKDDIGYYDFTPRPGYGGNTVLSGHVDWFTGELGVFADLKKLQKDDDVQVMLQDGKTYRYRVTDNQLYDADTAPVEEIIGDTPVESVTLITCEGTFNRASAEYNKRRVVRAERVYS
jgi:LPXTG-site transpeptidase (sortase) family protein